MKRRVTCSDCGHEYPPDYSQVDGDSCPECGSIALFVELETTDDLGLTDRETVGIGPAEHDRTAARRWEEVSGELSLLEQPLPDASQAVLFDAQRRLHALFIELWALRETTIGEGISAATVTRALKADPDGMALAHDLGNVAKHGPLNRPPMSPHKPTFDGLMAEQTASSGVWRLKAKVRHGPDEKDGLAVARRAVDGWETSLRAWKVL